MDAFELSTHVVLTGPWPPTDAERLRALGAALVPGETPTRPALEALEELLRLDHPVARAILLWHHSVATSYAHWGGMEWLLDALSSTHLRRIALAMIADPEWQSSDGMSRTSSLLRFLGTMDCEPDGAREPALEAWADRLSADTQASPGDRLAALSKLPDSDARRARLVALARGPTGDVAHEAATRLLTLEPSRYEELAFSLLDRDDADRRSESFHELRTHHDRAARERLGRSPSSAFVIAIAEHADLGQADVLVGEIPVEGCEAIRELHERLWQPAGPGPHVHDADIERMAAIDHPLARALALFYEQHGALSPCCRPSAAHDERMRSLARRVQSDDPLTLLPAARASRPRRDTDEDSHRMAAALLGRLGEPDKR